jgi:hypothetical protein
MAPEVVEQGQLTKVLVSSVHEMEWYLSLKGLQ